MGDKKRGSVSKQKLKAVLENEHLWPRVRVYAVHEMKPIVAEIKKRYPNDVIRKSLVNYSIIRTVSVFEIYLLNLSHRLARHDPDKTKNLFSDIKTSETLENQLVSVFSFTKLEDINNVFSNFIDEDFLTKIQKESVEYAPDYWYESEHMPYTKPLHKNWDEFIKIFEIRHDIIHHNKLVNFQYSYLKNLLGNTMQFLMCASGIVPHISPYASEQEELEEIEDI